MKYRKLPPNSLVYLQSYVLKGEREWGGGRALGDAPTEQCQKFARARITAIPNQIETRAEWSSALGGVPHSSRKSSNFGAANFKSMNFKDNILNII